MLLALKQQEVEEQKFQQAAFLRALSDEDAPDPEREIKFLTRQLDFYRKAYVQQIENGLSEADLEVQRRVIEKTQSRHDKIKAALLLSAGSYRPPIDDVLERASEYLNKGLTAVKNSATSGYQYIKNRNNAVTGMIVNKSMLEEAEEMATGRDVDADGDKEGFLDRIGNMFRSATALPKRAIDALTQSTMIPERLNKVLDETALVPSQVNSVLSQVKDNLSYVTGVTYFAIGSVGAYFLLQTLRVFSR